MHDWSGVCDTGRGSIISATVMSQLTCVHFRHFSIALFSVSEWLEWRWGETDRQTDRLACRQASRQTDKQTDRQTGRQANRQTDTK